MFFLCFFLCYCYSWVAICSLVLSHLIIVIAQHNKSSEENTHSEEKGAEEEGKEDCEMNLRRVVSFFCIWCEAQ